MDLSSNSLLAGLKKKDKQELAATKLSEASGVDLKAKDATPETLSHLADGKEPETSSQRKVYLALAAALPTVIGAAIGGSDGGQIGAKSTADVFGTLTKAAQEKEEKAQAAKDKANLAAIELASKREDRESQRSFQSEQNAMNRESREENTRLLAGMRGQDRAESREQKMSDKAEALEVPGFGPARTLEDAKSLKGGIEEKTNFDNKLNELINLRTEKGGGSIFDREAVGRAKQLSKDLLLSYKNMAKLGVLSQSDEAIINAIIPSDPLAFNSPVAALQGQDPILNNLKKFKQDSDKDFQTKLSLRLKNPPKAMDAGKDAATKPKTVMQNGHTYTLNTETGEYE